MGRAGAPATEARSRPYFWSFLQQAAEQVLFFGVSVLLARLLTPGDFGLVAMVAAITGFAGVLLDLGLGNALVHKKEVTQADLSTAFYVNFSLSAGLTIALIVAAPLIASFYGEPRLTFIARLSAPNFALAGFSVVDTALLRRRLHFRAIAVSSVLSAAVGAGVGIGLAVEGYGPIALAAQGVVRATVAAGLLRFQSGFSPSWAFSRASLLQMIHYGWGIIGANALNYWARNTDNLLIGRWMGSAQLGIYNRAYALMLLPMNTISRVVTTVLFPEMMRERDDPERMRAAFLRASARVAFVSFPLMAGMGASARALVLTVFGARWEPVVPLLQALAPLGLYQTIISLYGPIYLSLGRTDLDFKVSLLVETTIILAIVVGLQWGLVGLVFGLYAASVVNLFPTSMIPLRLLGLTARRFARSLAPTLTATVVMTAAVVVVGVAVAHWPHPATLGLQVSTGIVTYVLMCRALGVVALRDLTDGAVARWHRRSAAR